jgi:hypothetical protein
VPCGCMRPGQTKICVPAIAMASISINAPDMSRLPLTVERTG